MCKNVIAISGGSGSGKTTLAKMLKEHYSDDALLLSLDAYYNDLSHLNHKQRSSINFDHPDSQDINQLHCDILSLKNGKSISVPEYCFATHTRKAHSNIIQPKPVIILEGLYSYYDKRIASQADFKVYIDVSPDIRLIRRIRRDVTERGRDIDSILLQYETTVRKMYIEYIEIQKSEADIVINNDGENDLQDLLETLVKKIN